MQRRCVWGTVLMVPATALLLAAAGCGDEWGNSTAGSAIAVGAARGELAPEFELEKVGGGRLRLADLRGQAVIVDFWDTWCPPCRRALPHLQELHDEYGDQLTVVGIAFGRDGKETVARFLAERNLTFPCVFIDDRYETARDYGGVQSLPTTFLIDLQGVIREIWVGGQEKQAYAEALQQVLGV